MRVHLDTDFFVYALATSGPERRVLQALAASEHEIHMSAVAWYELARGPRSPEQLGAARGILGADGVVPFSDELASCAADVFRALGSPRRRAGDIAIGVTASMCRAKLYTRNRADFAGIPNLDVE
jgi:predicted nucleic acid-binding protein